MPEPAHVAGDADNTDRLRSAWKDFTDQLKAIGVSAIESAPNDIERLDGLRFVLRQLAYREEQFIEFPRGTTPEFFDPEGALPPIDPRLTEI